MKAGEIRKPYADKIMELETQRDGLVSELVRTHALLTDARTECGRLLDESRTYRAALQQIVENERATEPVWHHVIIAKRALGQ